MEKRTEHTATIAGYVSGFVLSLLLTALAYLIVTRDVIASELIVPAIAGLAVAQLIIQLVFFLHLGRESRPRWNMMAFLFMLLVVVIVVGGSLWIMGNLDYNMMPQNMDAYMTTQKDKGF